MTSGASFSQTTSRRANVERRRAAAKGLVFVCTNGAIVPHRGSALFRPLTDWRKYENQSVTVRDGLLLPSCRQSDILVGQPPLALTLDPEAILALLRAEDQGIHAASILGPPQEKTRNEDFALAAVIQDQDGNSHAFTAVADGVTTKTFWPERASRLACFTALRIAIDYVEAGAEYTVSDVAFVRQTLGEQLSRWLDIDRRWITAQGAAPPDWDPASFEKFSGNDAYWYNTTLLISLISDKGGLLLWAGDGAIHIRKDFGHNRFEMSSPLRSSDDVTVSNVVSLGGTILFSGGRVETDGVLKSLKTTLCSDGPDRTMQRNRDAVEFHDAADSPSIAAALERLTYCPDREIDNYSAATAQWPVPSAASILRETADPFLWEAKEELWQPKDHKRPPSLPGSPGVTSAPMRASTPPPNRAPASSSNELPDGYKSDATAITRKVAVSQFRKTL